MGDTVRQPSFGRGVLDPTLHARTDLEGYRTGLSVLRNMVVMRSGGVQNRAGFKFLAPTKFATTAASSVRIIPFIFNTDDGNAYAIEVGDLYMRFYKNGAQIRKTAVNISGITAANPGVITTGAAHGLVAGEEFYVSGIVGMKELNGRWFKAGTVGGGGTTVELLDRDSANINTTSYTTYVSGGTTEEVFELTTTYDEDDVFDLKYSQLNDVMILTHPTYPVRSLVRSSDTSWTISDTLFGPGKSAPRVLVGTRGAAGALTAKYKVTAVFRPGLFQTNGFESLPGTEDGFVISAITNADPGVVTTSASHGYSDDDYVRIAGCTGISGINEREFRINVTGATTFELVDIDTTSLGAYGASGACARTTVVITSSATPTTAAPNTFTIGTVGFFNAASVIAESDIIRYDYYKEHGGVFGYIGSSSGRTFSDTGVVSPDTADVPPAYGEIFNSTDNYPSCSCFHQQRLFFANTNNEPNGFWGSESGNFYTFTPRDPQNSSDGFQAELVGRRALQIRSLVALGKLVAFTSEGEYVVNGDSSGAITFRDVNWAQVSENGSNNTQAMLVNSSSLYVQSRSSMVRDLVKTPVQVDGYDGDERSIWASHLFRGYTITDSAYQQVPESMAWFVRSDGDLNAMTYIREQSMFGWHSHDTQGTFESVCTVPESTEDSLYAVVSRTVNGSSQRYIERLNTRHIGPDAEDVEDNVFVDSSISFDGRNTGAITMTLSTGTVWTAGTTLTITASSAYFNADMVGDKINVTDSAGTVAHCLITVSTSTTVMSVTSDIDIPAVMRNAAPTP